MGSGDLPLVSVIIPAHQRRDELKRCLATLFQQKGTPELPLPPFEVIIVDNGSTDGTAEMLATEFPQTIVLQNCENLGASQARNQALRIARGRYIWFLDSDSVVQNRDTLAWLIRLMEESPSIASLGGEITLGADGELLRVKFILPGGETTSKSLPPGEARLTDCDYLATCNCFVRRELLEELGGFDPSYFYLSEDKELGYRLKRLGYRNVCDGRTSVLHCLTPTQRRSLFQKYRNTIRFALKNLPSWEAILVPILIPLVRLQGLLSGRLRTGEPGAQKYTPPGLPRPLNKIALAVVAICAYACGMLWNLWHLPATLRSRFKKENYIENAPEALRYEKREPSEAL